MRARPALLAAATFLAACAPARRPAPVSTPAEAPLGFAVSLAYREPGPARRRVTLESTTSPETIYVSTADVVTLADVLVVRFRTDFEPEGLIEFVLTPDGRDRMARATADHVGKPMVMWLNGFAHSAPIVQTPIRDGVFQVTRGGTPAAEWEALATKLSDALGR